MDIDGSFECVFDAEIAASNLQIVPSVILGKLNLEGISLYHLVPHLRIPKRGWIYNLQ